MNELSPRGLELPPDFEEIDQKIKQLSQTAQQYETEINSLAIDDSEKAGMLQEAINELDSQAKPIYLGKEVQLEGMYSYPNVQHNNMTDQTLIEPAYEYGIRRGVSLGFYGKLVLKNPNIASDPSDDYSCNVALMHGIVMGSMSLASKYLLVEGRAHITARITESTISSAEIEDYKSRTYAELFVRQSKRDRKWTDKIDETLYKEGGPDLRVLGSRLRRLQALRPDRVEEYLSYVNAKLVSTSTVAQVVCRLAVLYNPSQTHPTLLIPDYVMEGYEPDICFADGYRVDRVNKTATRLTKGLSPTLSMRAHFENLDGERIVHVPLSAIECVDLK